MHNVLELPLHLGPKIPTEPQLTMWTAHPSIRPTVILLWSIVPACAIWGSIILGIGNKFQLFQDFAVNGIEIARRRPTAGSGALRPRRRRLRRADVAIRQYLRGALEVSGLTGKNGQLINVVPGKNLVMIRMGDAPDNALVPFTYQNDLWTKLNAVIGN